jgi:arginase
MTEVVALVGRTSDRAEGRAAGAEVLARELGGDEARVIGEPGQPHAGRYDEDLRDARPTLEAAAAAIGVGPRPLLTATDCSICVGSVPAVARRWPDAWLLWLDAHGDFNTPETTPSGFLGGMCLAGAVGLWDTGFGTGAAPERVVLVGGRDLDDAEVELMGRYRVVRTDDPASALAGREVFVHLDVDILDPEVMPGQLYPAPGGLDLAQLRELLAGVASRARIVGAEITCFSTPELSGELAQAVAPLVWSTEP